MSMYEEIGWGEIAEEVHRHLYEKHGIDFVNDEGILDFEKGEVAIEALRIEIRQVAQYYLALRFLDEIKKLLPEQRVDIFGLIFDEYCGRCGKQRDRECECPEEETGD